MGDCGRKCPRISMLDYELTACEATILDHNFKKGDFHFLSSLGFPLSHHSVDMLKHQENVTRRSKTGMRNTPGKKRKLKETDGDGSYSAGAF